MGYARIKLSFQTVVILWKLFDFLSPGGKNNRIKKKIMKKKRKRNDKSNLYRYPENENQS